MINNKLEAVTLDIRSAENIVLGRSSVGFLLHSLTAPMSDENTRSIILDRHVYLLARASTKDEQYITIALGTRDSIMALPDQLRDEAFGRLLKAAIISLSQSGAIPINWRPYHMKSFVSIQSNSKSSGETSRIVLDTYPKGMPGHIYAGFEHASKLEDTHPDYSKFDEAVKLLIKAPTSQEQPRADVSQLAEGYRLSDALVTIETENRTYGEWTKSLLTKDQMLFVNQPLTSSIRLMGPPGSGKTIALAVKALKTLSDASKEGKSFRLLVLTHALATTELIEHMLNFMDPSGSIIGDLSDKGLHLDVTTIFSLANLQMNFDLDGLKPLSLDGTEGRVLQFELLEGVIKDFLKNDWVAFRSGCSSPFIECVEDISNTVQGRRFVWELMNEFACVLDAEGGRPTGERRKRYMMEEKRKSWMMRLNPGAEREVVLELYERFKDQLAQMQTITGDQMIADHLNWLEMNKWQALRKTRGYDAIFVDELHLFNRQERMVFKKLLRNPDAPPVIVMAYDPKQSPRDTFAGLAGASDWSNFWMDAKLGKTEKIELIDVFRYTPQISRALALIDQSFPGQELDDEWPSYTGVSRIENGPTPTYKVFKDTNTLYEQVFPRAKEVQRALGATKKVAILCASYDLFSKYADAGKFKNDFVVISSREDLPKTKDTSNKYIFSAPEYVAGLQFDTVFLIEVNDDEIPDGAYRTSSERKFLSVLYLGASRAERNLEIYSTKEHGGPSSLLKMAFNQGAIVPA